MIDWNNNGKIDPEEFVLTEIMLEDAEKDDADREHIRKQRASRGRGAGCLTGLMFLAAAIGIGCLLQGLVA